MSAAGEKAGTLMRDEGEARQPDAPPAGRPWLPRWTGPLVGTIVLALAAFLLWRTLGRYSYGEIAASVRAAATTRLAPTLGFAAASYLCLTLFDWMGLRYVGRPLPWRRAALASFCALSIGHNLGFAAVSSGAVRYRFYRRWGLSKGQIARLILFCGATVGVGLLSLAALAFLSNPRLVAGMTGAAEGAVLALGLAALALVGLYLLLAATVRRPLRLRGFTLAMPHLPLALAQVLVGTLNFALVAACLHQALGAVAPVSYPQAVAAYVAANAGVLVSHVPGGLGVLEAVVSFLLPGAALVGGLLLFRFCYYLVPLALGAATLGISEILYRRRAKAVSAGASGGAGSAAP